MQSLKRLRDIGYKLLRL